MNKFYMAWNSPNTRFIRLRVRDLINAESSRYGSPLPVANADMRIVDAISVLTQTGSCVLVVPLNDFEVGILNSDDVSVHMRRLGPATALWDQQLIDIPELLVVHADSVEFSRGMYGLMDVTLYQHNKISGATLNGQTLVASEAVISGPSKNDELSGLPGRNLLRQCCDIYRRQSSQVNTGCFFFIVFDIDFFKGINDCHGHLMGDKAIQAMSQCCLLWTETIDLRMRMARIGGDEFGGVGRGASLTSFEKSLRTLADLVEAIGVDIPPLTISIGACVVSPDKLVHATFDDLLETADRCLYASKKAGRNQAHIADYPIISRFDIRPVVSVR